MTTGTGGRGKDCPQSGARAQSLLAALWALTCLAGCGSNDRDFGDKAEPTSATADGGEGGVPDAEAEDSTAAVPEGGADEGGSPDMPDATTSGGGGGDAGDSAVPGASLCGDGTTQSGETCDDGAGNSDSEPDACRTDCSAARCGDGVQDSGEQCDDPASVGVVDCAYGVMSCSLCDDTCTLSAGVAHYCGDGVLDAGESCDEGADNGQGPGHCSESCDSVQACGDGKRQGTEACDDGSNNGRPTRCDLGCAFVCSGNCPLRVDVSAPGGGDGRTWASAYANLQLAVNAAAANGGGEIWIARGTYTSPGTTPVLTIPTLATGMLAIYGGFGAFELTRDERAANAPATILDGRQMSYHVVRGNGSYLLDGVTITGGNAIGGGDDGKGGGVFTSGGAPSLTNCLIRDNFARSRGGGMHSQGATYPTLSKCAFERNSVSDASATDSRGGGLSADYRSVFGDQGRLSVLDCAFVENIAEYGGGAIYVNNLSQGELRLERVTFSGDEGSSVSGDSSGGAVRLELSRLHAEDIECERAATRNGHGGCLYLDGWPATITRARLSGGAANAGGAIYSRSDLTLTDSWVHDTSSLVGSAGISIGANTTAYIYNTVFVDNRFGVNPVAITSSGTLEVVNCTFTDNFVEVDCTPGGGPCRVPIVAVDESKASVVNSVFWRERAPAYATHSCGPGLTGTGNVALAGSPFDGDSVLLSPGSPCSNAGDAAAAAAAGLDWQALTTQTSGCRDSGTIDMGAHHPVVSGAAPCP